MNTERKVKGELLVDFVKMIRAAKDLPWKEHLKPEDMEIVNSMVIPTSWYPVESYQRMALAVWELVAKRNEEVVHEYGRQAMRELLKGFYRPHLDRGDPFQAVDKFLGLRRSLFSFSRTEVKKKGENNILVRISGFGSFEGMDIYALLIAAYLQALIEFNRGKDVKYDIQETREQDEQVYLINIEWK
jgi:hypothetical protein